MAAAGCWLLAPQRPRLAPPGLAPPRSHAPAGAGGRSAGGAQAAGAAGALPLHGAQLHPLARVGGAHRGAHGPAGSACAAAPPPRTLAARCASSTPASSPACAPAARDAHLLTGAYSPHPRLQGCSVLGGDSPLPLYLSRSLASPVAAHCSTCAGLLLLRGAVLGGDAQRRRGGPGTQPGGPAGRGPHLHALPHGAHRHAVGGRGRAAAAGAGAAPLSCRGAGQGGAAGSRGCEAGAGSRERRRPGSGLQPAGLAVHCHPCRRRRPCPTWSRAVC